MSVIALRAVDTLEEAAVSINRQFEIADREHDKSKSAGSKEYYARLTAGVMLLDARKRVEAETDMGWEAWCKQNVNKSQSYIRKCMQDARSSHPEHALDERRADTKDSMRKTREKRSHVGAVEQAINLIKAMTPDELMQFDAAYRSFKEGGLT